MSQRSHKRFLWIGLVLAAGLCGLALLALPSWRHAMDLQAMRAAAPAQARSASTTASATTAVDPEEAMTVMPRPGAFVAWKRPNPTEIQRNLDSREGEVPPTPPIFKDANDRAVYKAWWVDEFSRRIEFFEKRRPADYYPTKEETVSLLERLYDAAEPQRPGESDDANALREQTYLHVWAEFFHAFQDTPKSVQSFGGNAMRVAGHDSTNAPPIPVPDDGPTDERRPAGPAPVPEILNPPPPAPREWPANRTY